MNAQALWIIAPGTAEIRPAADGLGSIEVETLFTGISRGTEALVFRGEVPESEWVRMRCPLQEGEFPFPVKYGYSAVGLVRRGPPHLEGHSVFVLHPHQDRFSTVEELVLPLPDPVPPGRAVLAANMETALNILWDAGAAPGDRIAVVGTGVVGALVGMLAARIPGTDVTLVDLNPMRAELATALGCGFAMPDSCPQDCDVVVHASATPGGLRTALSVAGREARVVEASWYGMREITVPLGESFHSKRLALVASQVGAVTAKRRARWTNRRRLETALRFEDLPDAYGAILADPATLCHRVRY
jgi:threonine dehydrogenase-like Zn-dependent dehydrogenase